MERVRRNTRPYVGAMDWYPPINFDPSTESDWWYYGTIEMDGCFRPNILWRHRSEGGLHYEEVWSARSKSWEPTLYLTKMIIGGECSLADMTAEQATRVAPEAFEMKEEIK